MNKFIRDLRCNGDCELVYLRPFYNLDRDNIHYVCDYDEDKIGVNVFALYEENQELKKQLEDKDMLIKQCELSVANVMDCYCERTDCSGRIKDSKTYDSLVQQVENQQKEFIEYLESYLKIFDKKDIDMEGYYDCIEEILSKYKEIIGDKNDR